MSIIKSIFKVMKNGAWNEHYFKTSSDQVVHTKTDGQASTVKEQLDGLNSALANKSELKENGYGMYYRTVTTDFDDRVDALKTSIRDQTMAWPEGITICYVVSNNSDDRGLAIVLKKTQKNRCAFHYFDYWGVNEFWTLTDAGWEQK